MAVRFCMDQILCNRVMSQVPILQYLFWPSRAQRGGGGLIWELYGTSTASSTGSFRGRYYKNCKLDQKNLDIDWVSPSKSVYHSLILLDQESCDLAVANLQVASAPSVDFAHWLQNVLIHTSAAPVLEVSGEQTPITRIVYGAEQMICGCVGGYVFPLGKLFSWSQPNTKLLSIGKINKQTKKKDLSEQSFFSRICNQTFFYSLLNKPFFLTLCRTVFFSLSKKKSQPPPEVSSGPPLMQ